MTRRGAPGDVPGAPLFSTAESHTALFAITKERMPADGAGSCCRTG